MNAFDGPVTVQDKQPAAGRRRPGKDSAHLPAPMLAVIEALRFQHSSLERMEALNEKEWPALLAWCDRRQLSLMLPAFCGDALPVSAREKLSRKRADFEARMKRLKSQLAKISLLLSSGDLPFVILKGFTHSPQLTPDPIWRAQGDIDLWCQAEIAPRAHNLLRQAGYRAAPSASCRHLPPLLPPDAWQWNGNLAEIPIGVEIHHQLWSDVSGHIRIPDHGEMWDRREKRCFDGHTYEVLATPDLLAFAALHFFLHLIHGDLPLQRIWEIAHFLHTNSDNSRFWRSWRDWHSPQLRQIQAIVFRIAEDWFHCEMPSCAAEEAEALPSEAQVWIDHFVFSPLRSQVDSNKNYVWLHLALTRSLASKCRIIGACFLPASIPTVVGRIDGHRIAGLLRNLVRQRSYLIGRTEHHVRSVLPTLLGGVRFAAKNAGFKEGFGSFLLANALFDVGEFLFVLLYNLYLLDLGFREDILGLITAAMTGGTLVGTPIAAWAERRIGLRGLMVLASLGGALATILRVFSANRTTLLLTAALNGFFFAFWAVAFAPAVASLTRPRNRSVAFGLVTAMGMSLGIAVGVIGVRLPEWAVRLTGSASSAAGKKTTILVGSALVMLAAIPAMRLRIPPREQTAEKTYPRGPFIRRFTAALFLFIAATSSFNGFATAYLSLHVHLALRKIGTVFAGGQSLQVIALLFGPLLIRQFGERAYVFLTALGTAGMLLLLAISPQHLEVAAYLSYMALQYMNEPSLFGMLMNGVRDTQRTGASSLMLITMSVASTVAAALAGRAITRFDYPVCLLTAALLAGAAAILFACLPRPSSEI
jgi:predicted MFS family arabinose efflux permease